MPVKNYIPLFPYKGRQILITSDRVVLHAKNDAIFFFGKQAIGLSSPGRVNIDTGTGTTINAPEIELGLQAKSLGQPIVKAQSLIEILSALLIDLQKASEALSNISDTGLEESLPDIVKSTEKLKGTCARLKVELGSIKSNITYTR